MRNAIITSIAAVSIFALNPIAPAHAAPSQLLNKTVTVNLTVAIPGKGTDGSSLNTSSPVQRVIYISSAGRVFSRTTRTGGSARQQAERGPEAGSSGGSLSFSGNKLVGGMPIYGGSGATLWTISFDPSFQSCTAEVIVGKDSGKPIVWKGFNGVSYTATGKAVISGVSCSIRDGNALAN